MNGRIPQMLDEVAADAETADAAGVEPDLTASRSLAEGRRVNRI
ncbi:hypothetical protein ABQF34_06145 [Mycolicibacterium boenickei]